MTPEEIRAQIATLQAQLPVEPLLEEPSDIRKTNASDDPCPMCQTVHSKDPAAPLVCRCLYCGQIGPIAMSTHDARMGMGVVCRHCCGGFGPDYLARAEAEALARASQQPKMPWEGTS